MHNIQSVWMFVLVPLDTYWGHKIHSTDCFSARISKAQKIVNMENGPFSLNSITHENSHCYSCNNCTTDNLRSHIIQSVTFHLFQAHMQNNLMWKLCLHCDVKYLCEQVYLLLKTVFRHSLYTLWKDWLLGGLGLWQLLLKHIWHFITHWSYLY